MCPISVSMPVAVTISSPRPRVTAVFMYAMQVRSPSGTSSPGTGSVDLPTGRLSPVSAASSISRVAATQTRPSAGTRLPASTSTTSPGTSSSASISIAWPSAAYPGDGLHHLGQRLDALLGLGLLAQPDHGVEEGEPGQHHRRADLAGHDQVDDRRHQQHDLHEVLVLAQEGAPARLLLARGQLVRPVRLQPGRASAAESPARDRRRADGRPRPRHSRFGTSTSASWSDWDIKASDDAAFHAGPTIANLISTLGEHPTHWLHPLRGIGAAHSPPSKARRYQWRATLSRATKMPSTAPATPLAIRPHVSRPPRTPAT